MIIYKVTNLINNKIKGVKKLHFQKIFERNTLHEQAN